MANGMWMWERRRTRSGSSFPPPPLLSVDALPLPTWANAVHILIPLNPEP